MAYPIGSTADGRVRWSDGSITGNMSTKSGYASNVSVPNTKQVTNNYSVPGKAVTTNGGNNGGSGGSGNTGSNNNSSTVNNGNNEVDIAQRRYQAAKDAIVSKLNMMKEEAGRLRGEAKKGYDFTTGEVTKNYTKLKELSGQKLAQAMEALGLQDTNVQNIYGRVAGNARRAMEGALTRNRMLNRAMGSLGSSFYSNSQGDTTNQGMNAVNDTAVEEADKRNIIGTQKSSTTTDFAQNDVAMEAEANQLRQTALQKHDNDIAQANMLEKTYNIDSEAAITEANNNLDSAMNQIRQYALSSKPAATTASTYQDLSAKLPTYNAVAPIQDKLNNNTNYAAANSFINKANTTGTGNGLSAISSSAANNLSSYNPASPNWFLNQKKSSTKKEDPTSYFLNPTF